MCEIDNCIMCEHEDFVESIANAMCKHNQGYVSSIYGGLYCAQCGADVGHVS